MLRPQEGEDGQLEVVRLAVEQGDDAGELAVRETEPAVKRVFRDGAQAASLAPAPVAMTLLPPRDVGRD
jgi:hypothetical protein